MRIDGYLNRVCNQIKWKAARQPVREELHSHLMERVEEYRVAGEPADAAEEKAVANMGNALQTGRDLNRLHRPRYDWVLIGALAGLLILGLVQAALANHQTSILLSATAAGLLPMVFFAFMDVNRFLNNKWAMFAVCLVLVGGLSALAATETMYEFRRTNWYNLITDFPVAMLMITFGTWVSRIKNVGKIACFLLATLGCVIIMLLIPITTLALSFLVCLWAMLWTMNIRNKWFILSLLTAIGLLSLWILIQLSQPYRLELWFNSMLSDTSAGWQLWQVKYRVANLNWFGVGNPAPNIMQYGISFDEYALIGFMWKYGLSAGLTVIILCGVVLWRVYRILLKLRDRTARAVAVGICTYITMQVIWNVLMNFGVMPGLLYANLPFFSQVWSQSLILGTMFGILIGLYRKKDIYNAYSVVAIKSHSDTNVTS